MGSVTAVFDSTRDNVAPRSGAKQQLTLQVRLDDSREFLIDILSYNGQDLNKTGTCHLIDSRTVGEVAL
jgi:hypothetical protein